jgi:hypothetical protein
MADQAELLRRGREAAAAYRAAVTEMTEFLDRNPVLPDPAVEAEYATLLAREQSLLAKRQEALHALGLATPSLEGDEPA